MAQNDFVSVTIVTYNSGRFIKRCLESVLAQRYRLKEIVVVDNASTDGTIDILEQFEDRCQVYYNDRNVGFAAAQNQAIKLSNGDWALTLNPDVLLLPNFIQSLGGCRPVRFFHRGGVRQAADHVAAFRDSRASGGGFHGHLLQSDAAAPGPREPGSG